MNFLFIFLLPILEISANLKHNVKNKNKNLKFYNTAFPILKSDSLHHLQFIPKSYDLMVVVVAGRGGGGRRE